MRIDRRWLIGALGTSFLLNAFLAGILIGHAVARHRAPRGAEGPLAPPVRVRALPDDERETFQAAMAPHRDAIRAARRAVRAARLAVESDIAAPTFDRPKVESDLAAFRKATAIMLETSQAALVEALKGLPERARATLVMPRRGNDEPANGVGNGASQRP